jgi:hypothetical protein
MLAGKDDGFSFVNRQPNSNLVAPQIETSNNL